jgi:hypothetical protein
VPPGRDEALSAVRRTTRELADVAEKTADEAERLLADAQHHGHGAGDRGPAVSQGRLQFLP